MHETRATEPRGGVVLEVVLDAHVLLDGVVVLALAHELVAVLLQLLGAAHGVVLLRLLLIHRGVHLVLELIGAHLAHLLARALDVVRGHVLELLGTAGGHAGHPAAHAGRHLLHLGLRVEIESGGSSDDEERARSERSRRPSEFPAPTLARSRRAREEEFAESRADLEAEAGAHQLLGGHVGHLLLREAIISGVSMLGSIVLVGRARAWSLLP